MALGLHAEITQGYQIGELHSTHGSSHGPSHVLHCTMCRYQPPHRPTAYVRLVRMHAHATTEYVPNHRTTLVLLVSVGDGISLCNGRHIVRLRLRLRLSRDVELRRARTLGSRVGVVFFSSRGRRAVPGWSWRRRVGCCVVVGKRVLFCRARPLLLRRSL